MDETYETTLISSSSCETPLNPRACCSTAVGGKHSNVSPGKAAKSEGWRCREAIVATSHPRPAGPRVHLQSVLHGREQWYTPISTGGSEWIGIPSERLFPAWLRYSVVWLGPR